MPAHTWIPVEHFLPGDDTTVMMANRRWPDPVWLGYCTDGCWMTVDGLSLGDPEPDELEDGYGDDWLPPTHWMPMPIPPPAEAAPPLLLPAPVFHECQRCGIHTGTMAEYPEEMDGVYFIERRTRLGNAWDVCSLCEPEYQFESARARITFSRGVPPWCGEEHAFFGFEEMPMLCVAPDDSADGWVYAEPQIGEVWLFCRNRQEFRSAWQIARTIVRYDGWPVTNAPIPFFLPAYKPSGAFHLIYATATLNNRAPDAGPKVGQCDRCHTHSVLVKARPGTQWAECEDCHDAEVARLAGKEAGV